MICCQCNLPIKIFQNTLSPDFTTANKINPKFFNLKLSIYSSVLQMLIMNCARFLSLLHLKSLETQVQLPHPLPTLTVKTMNYLLWHTQCHHLGSTLGTTDTEMHKTQRPCSQGAVIQYFAFKLSTVTMRHTHCIQYQSGTLLLLFLLALPSLLHLIKSY